MAGNSDTKERILALLKAKGALRLPAIAEALGIAASSASTHCATLRAAGTLVACDVRLASGRHSIEYRLAAGPVAPFVPLKPAATARPQRPGEGGSEWNRDESRASPFPRFEVHEVEEIEAAPAPDLLPAAEAAALQNGFRVAYWSDGELTLLLPDGNSVTLNPEQTRLLAMYLDGVKVL